MLRIRPLFVTAITLLTVVACEKRPSFKKSDGEIANGIFQDDKFAKDNADSDFETLGYSNFSVKENNLFFEGMKKDGSMADPVVVGNISKAKGQTFQLKPNSELPQIAESDELNQPLKEFLNWMGGNNVRVILHDKTLKLTNAANQTNNYRFTSPDSAKGVQAKIQTNKSAHASQVNTFLGLLTNKVMVLSKIVQTKLVTDPKAAAINDQTDANDQLDTTDQTDLTDPPANESRTPQSDLDEESSFSIADSTTAIKPRSNRVTRPVQPPRQKIPKDFSIEAKDVKEEEITSGGLLVNAKRLFFKEKDNQVVAVINDKWEAKVTFQLMKNQYGEDAKNTGEKASKEKKRLALYMEIQGLADGTATDLKVVNAQQWGVIVDSTEKDASGKEITVVRLVTKTREDRRDRTGTSREFVLVDSIDPIAHGTTSTTTATPRRSSPPTPAQPVPAAPPITDVKTAPTSDIAKPETMTDRKVKDN